MHSTCFIHAEYISIPQFKLFHTPVSVWYNFLRILQLTIGIAFFFFCLFKVSHIRVKCFFNFKHWLTSQRCWYFQQRTLLMMILIGHQNITLLSPAKYVILARQFWKQPGDAFTCFDATATKIGTQTYLNFMTWLNSVTSYVFPARILFSWTKSWKN